MNPCAPYAVRVGGRTVAPRGPESPPVPVTGDVLASERSSRADLYDISIVPAASRAAVTRYAEAIQTVRELAHQLRVDGWFTSDQTHYACVAPYRAQQVR
jgi:hypothetical protein